MQDYKTVAAVAESELIEKKSRFIAHVFPVSTEDEAIGRIDEIRSRYTDASHNVYAYICRENHAMRYSDDGEPSGTAGMPVLNVLQQQRLTDVCVIVTRYFGGTLLGTGGLVRAYSKSAADGVIAAGVCRMLYAHVFRITTEYALLGKLQYAIAENGFTITDTAFGEQVELTVYAAAAEGERLQKTLIEATNGKISITTAPPMYVATTV